MPSDAVEAEHRLAALQRKLAELNLRSSEATAEAAEQLEHLRRELRYMSACNEVERKYNTALLDRLKKKDELLDKFVTSTSWRMTAPLRALVDALRPRRDRPRRMRAAPSPTIFIECSHTYRSDMNTGIQRVVRNILRCAPAIASRYGLRVVPLSFSVNAFFEVDAAPVLRDKQHPVSGEPPAGFSPPGETMPPEAIDLDEYADCGGSILLLLDASWDSPLWSAVERFKQRGGKVVGVIYDLIPMTHSHRTVDQLTDVFAPWICEHLRHTDAFVCISRSTADDLGRFIRQRNGGAAAPMPIDHFHLGSDLDFIDAKTEPDDGMKVVFGVDRHCFLMVGSIEPRKMHGYVLDAFDRFWSRGGDATLVIIGGHSWKATVLIDRVTAHPEWNRRLFMIRNASDTELDYAYRNASSLIIASEIEGFGLPIVESFQRGLPVMCSDIPVFHEIADGRARFFDLRNPDSLTSVLTEYCETHDPAQRTVRRPQEWLNWPQSTEQLFAAIDRALGLKKIVESGRA